MFQKSTAMSIFQVGYLIMNLIASVLVTKFQNKMILFVSVGGSSVLTLLTPILIIVGGYYTLISIRVLLGLLQGSMMAVSIAQLSRWIPLNERSRCSGLVLGGINFGTMVSFGVSGWIGSNYGWPSIFYFSGSAGLAWSILWAVFAADDPKSCWFISQEERAYIEEELILTSEIKKDKKIPWKGLFSNKACLALLLTSLGHYWSSWTLLNEIPTYFHSILHLDSTFNGLITALPHGCLCIFPVLSSYISDKLISRKTFSIGTCRKIFNTIGQCGAAAAILILSFTTDVTATLAIYTVGAVLLGCVNLGFMFNHLDIVPSHAGFYMGITNGLSTISSFAGPEFAGIIITDPENEQLWRIVFGVSAGAFFLSNLIFITFGSGEVQLIKEDQSSDDSYPEKPNFSLGTVINVKS